MKKVYGSFVLLIIYLGLTFFYPTQLYSQIQNQKCLICHGKSDFSVKREDGTVKSLFVDEKLHRTQILPVTTATMILLKSVPSDIRKM